MECVWRVRGEWVEVGGECVGRWRVCVERGGGGGWGVGVGCEGNEQI